MRRMTESRGRGREGVERVRCAGWMKNKIGTSDAYTYDGGRTLESALKLNISELVTKLSFIIVY